MERGPKQTTLTRRLTSTLCIALAMICGAAPLRGAALFFGQPNFKQLSPRAAASAFLGATLATLIQRRNPASSRALPASARFHEAEGRGLLVEVWVNDSGPYSFALDTGAGASLISPRVVAASQVLLSGGREVRLSGLSGMSGAGREATLRSLSLGARENYLPGAGFVIVTDDLPPDLDGVLDPTESYYPLGYAIDLPGETITAFDPRATPLRGLAPPEGGAIVPWLSDGNSRRPFVALDAGRRALLDTGSGFGLAISESAARSFGLASGRRRGRASVQDLGRGRVETRRIEPLTVRVGALTLRRVPTDLLMATTTDAPVLLGRDALRPFEISFDPINRLIRLRPGAESSRR